MAEPAFVPGIELSARFYAEAVRPLLGNRPHAAGLLGWGSDVLGYDTYRSTDHGWGPRLIVFLDADSAIADLDARLADQLPDRFMGWPVRFGWDDVAVSHHVTVTTLPRWLDQQLGFDATRGATTLDWLLTPQQRLVGFTAGAVYVDHLGELTSLRRDLAWYPDQVWRWMLASQWHRLAQEEAFVARAAEVGDEVGAAVTAARQVRDIMRLALLLHREYWPYSKWLGTAFARAPHNDRLARHLDAVVRATHLPARESALGDAYVEVADQHNRSGVTMPVDCALREYHSRPARVLMADRFASACSETLTDDMLRKLPLIGAVDQLVDSADALSDPVTYRRLAGLYSPKPSG